MDSTTAASTASTDGSQQQQLSLGIDNTSATGGGGLLQQQESLDMNEFPSLGGSIRPPSQQAAMPYRLATVGSNFNMDATEFPALGGGLGGPVAPTEATSSGGLLGGLRAASTPAPAVTATASSSDASASPGDYGLLGLLSVIRMTDADRNALALGTDLNLLGLHLGSTEQVYSTFAGPFAEEQAKEPHFTLPSCYYMSPPALKTGHLAKFQLETLFYIFYALPKDILQAYAAQELYNREWKYHTELQLWCLLDNGQYVYFDKQAWERRVWNKPVDTTQFLSAESVRVQVAQ